MYVSGCDEKYFYKKAVTFTKGLRQNKQTNRKCLTN